MCMCVCIQHTHTHTQALCKDNYSFMCYDDGKENPKTICVRSCVYCLSSKYIMLPILIRVSK